MANAELENKHADDLSVGRYTFKKIRETLVVGGSAIAGTVAGFFGGKLFKGDGGILPENIAVPHESGIVGGFRLFKVPEFIKNATKPQLKLAGAGAILGAAIGAIVIGYEHWRKQEAQKLAVDEINQDMANTIAIQPTDKELVSENKRLRGMLEEMEHTHHTKHAAAHGHGPKSPMDHATREPSLEQGRG